MSSLVLNLFNPENEKVVELAYRVQKKVYGVYVPPTLKQVITLKELLISTGIRKDFKPDELLGLSRIECKLLIDELRARELAQLGSINLKATKLAHLSLRSKGRCVLVAFKFIALTV